ncbi:MAG TPA: hypothetical protein VFN10_05220 [Thermoanaerobaculia bacterium]|nr:hypothetical protein [Thermoanaerobaculia bacterium]
MRRALLAFLAGFLATLIFHQPALWLLRAIHFTDRAPYAMKPVPPFGIPSVISLAFWGGVWGIVMIVVIAKARRNAYWLAATAFGAVLPTLVAGLVVMPLKGQPVGGGAHAGSMLVLGLIVNAAWGLGTAILYRAFGGK